MREIPTVAIVGRPNIGKSSLFNIIVGRRMAIVHEESGVTRDRIVAPAVFKGKHFQVADTGGLGTFTAEKKKQGFWDGRIRQQVETAVESADLILFMVDVTTGLTPLDEDILKSLRAGGKKFILVVNKVDSNRQEKDIADFYSISVDEIYPLSCTHRRGITALMDAIVKNIDAPTKTDREETLRITVVGRPNVGKSSIVNAFLGEERVLVSDIAGTTRDAVDIDVTIKGKQEDIKAVMVDTAGLRKRGRANTAVEVFSIMRAESAVKRSDIILMVVEADKYGVTAQDKKIARMIETSGKGCIIIANKYDLIKDKISVQDAEEELRYSLKFLRYAPIIFVSALKGDNFSEIPGLIAKVKNRMNMKIPTPFLNNIVNDAVKRTPPPIIGKKPLKIYYAAMIGTAPPRIVLFVNNKQNCSKNYLTYLNNVLRKNLDFTGWPIVLILKNRPKPKLNK